MKHNFLIAALFSLVGCSDDTDHTAALARFEGIYEVKLHAMNEQACSPENATPIPGNDKFVVAVVEEALGTPYLQIASCASVTACRDLARNFGRGLVSYEYGFTLARPDGQTDLVGEGATTGFNNAGVCTQGDIHVTTLMSTADSRPAAFRIQKAITIADDYPAIGGDTCDTRNAKSAADGNTCSQMEVLSVILAEPL